MAQPIALCYHPRTMRSLTSRAFPLLFAALVAFASVPQHVSAAPDSAPTFATATDAVLYMAGYLDADSEIAGILAIPTPHLPFRTLALLQLNLAAVFRLANLPETGVQFMLGRAARFNVAADVAGEPPFAMLPILGG